MHQNVPYQTTNSTIFPGKGHSIRYVWHQPHISSRSTRMKLSSESWFSTFTTQSVKCFSASRLSFMTASYGGMILHCQRCCSCCCWWWWWWCWWWRWRMTLLLQSGAFDRLIQACELPQTPSGRVGGVKLAAAEVRSPASPPSYLGRVCTVAVLTVRRTLTLGPLCLSVCAHIPWTAS